MHLKVPQIGNVIIEDDVEVGANVTIDRGALGSTLIGRGTKIDNLVQIAHNVVVGENCMICGQVGIAGSVTIGDRVVLAGQVGVADHVTIGSDVVVAARSGVATSLPARMVAMGTPAIARAEATEIYMHQRRLKRLFRDVGEMKQRLNSIESGNKKG